MMTIQESKEYHRKHYRENKARYMQHKYNQKNRARKWILDYKKTLYCVKCGEPDFRCLNFHHIDPNDKFMSITNMVIDGYNIKRIQEEIKKCQVLCANCHSKITGENWYYNKPGYNCGSGIA